MIHQDKIVVGENGLQNVLRRHIFQMEGDGRK